MLRVLSCLLILTAFAGTCFGGDSPETAVSEGHVASMPESEAESAQATPAVSAIASALALVEENQITLALDALDSISPEFFELGFYHYVRGRALLVRDPMEAAFHYRRSSTYANEAEEQETMLLLAARTALDAGYRFEAKNDCVIFLHKFPDSPRANEARILLARSLSGIGRFHDAIRQFEMVGKTPDALFGKANVHQRMGMTREAAQAYSSAMSTDSKFPDRDDDTRLWMGENLRLSGLTSRAKALLSKVKAPDNMEYAALGLAEIEIKESQIDRAIWRLARLSSAKDKKLGRIATLRAAELEASVGKMHDAATRLDELVSKYPFTTEYDYAVMRLAQVRAATGDDTEALSLLARLVARHSAVRAQALDLVEKVLMGAREKGPEHLASLWGICGNWIMDPSRESSLVMIADALRGTPPYEDLTQWLSRYGSTPVRTRYVEMQTTRYTAAGDVEGMRASLNRLKFLGASGDTLARTEGNLKLAEKDYAGAEQALLSIERMEDKDIAMLEEMLPHLADPRKTIAVLDAAISRPDAPMDAITHLADTYSKAGLMDQTIAALDAAASRPDAPLSVFTQLADIHSKAGRTDQMIAALDAAASRPDAPLSVFTQLADIHSKAGRVDKAIAALEAAVSRPDVLPRMFTRLADTYYDAGDTDKAIAYYRKAVDKDPGDEWSCYRLFVLLGKDKGDEYRRRIVKDQALVRMADLIWKERNRDGK